MADKLAGAIDTDALAVYRRLLGYAGRHWPMFVAAIAGMTLYAATDTALAYLMKPLLDAGFVARDPAAIRLIAMLLVLLALTRGITGFTGSYCINWVGRKVIKKLRQDLFDKYLDLPTAFFDRSSSGHLLSKLTYNIEQVAESATRVATLLIRDSLTILGLVAYMFYLNALLSVFILIEAPLIAVLVRYVSRRFRRYSTRIQDSMGDVTRVTEEVLEGNRVVKVFGGQDYERSQFSRVNEKNRRLHMRLIATKDGSNALILFIAAIGLSAIIYVSTLESLLEEITVGTFASFLGAMLLLMAPLRRLTDINAPLQRGIAAGESIFEILDEPAESEGGDLPLERASGSIEFRHVYFAYGRDASSVLEDIDFSVEAGETIAIVGRSGSGKTTLASMLPRFYDPLAGEILIDGHDIRRYRRADLRRQIALVSQHVTLFNDSIAHNIAYGALKEASRERIEQAADAAYVLEFAREFPRGLDTVVGDRGVLLSGGQRQRIAIARALLKDAPILILDEATSALDTESERIIQAALHRLMRNRTTLVIAHRLSTVERADRIVVLEKGRLVESGTHAELMQNDGHYAALHRMQFSEPSQRQRA